MNKVQWKQFSYKYTECDGFGSKLKHQQKQIRVFSLTVVFFFFEWCNVFFKFGPANLQKERCDMFIFQQSSTPFKPKCHLENL